MAAHNGAVGHAERIGRADIIKIPGAQELRAHNIHKTHPGKEKENQ